MSLRWAALRVCLLLSGLFIAGYGATNWITSQRTDTGVWMHAWERHIPFVPHMTIPYMSIDLFFVLAPFLCADRRELSVLARRVRRTIRSTSPPRANFGTAILRKSMLIVCFRQPMESMT